MAVVSVTAKKYEGGSVDERYIRSYRVLYEVITNSPLDGPLTVMNATVTGTAITFLQLIGRTYMDQNGVTDLGAVCVLVEPEQGPQEQRLAWTVRCEFASKGRDPAQAVEDPLLRPADIRWDTAKYSQAIDKANLVAAFNAPIELDVAIANSAGEKFDPPVEIDQSRRILVVTRNESFFDAFVADAYQDCVNDDSFGGFAPGVAKIDSIVGEKVWENNSAYWKVTYTIHFRYEGWLVEKRDEGFYELDDDGERVNITGADGKALSAPAPLDGDGGKLAADEDDVFRLFQVYRSAAFGPLLLPV